jgi:hypothetical protein
MLEDEITKAQRLVKTDAYQMSMGEIVSMYESHEITIDPEFQRYFRWENSQKSRFVESILLGIPIPSIFVFEQADGRWELIDGLQRVSTLLEFMGKLHRPEGGIMAPSILDGTKYLPSLHNAVWNKSNLITDVPPDKQNEIGKTNQLAIRRARIGVEILKRPSDEKTKYDLFQRLNAGGTQANPQELRNCIMLMVSKEYYRSLKTAAEGEAFREVLAVTEDQIERQKHMEYATRFVVHVNVPYDGTLDVEEYIDESIVTLAGSSNGAEAARQIDLTFGLLNRVEGRNALRRFENGHYTGKVGLVGLEGIAVGIAKNIRAILSLSTPNEFVRDRIQTFWSQPQAANFTSPGLRGTTRIQRTVPFGEDWFRP